MSKTNRDENFETALKSATGEELLQMMRDAQIRKSEARAKIAALKAQIAEQEAEIADADDTHDQAVTELFGRPDE